MRRRRCALDESYEYDENGNRIDNNGTTNSIVGNNRLDDDGTFAYQYDQQGNRTRREASSNPQINSYTTYTWDHRNRLERVEEYDASQQLEKTVSYTYDSDNQLLSRTVVENATTTETYFVHDESQIVLQFDGSSASDLTHRYIWGPQIDQQLADEQVSDVTQAGRTIWPLTDQLGTVRDLAEWESTGTGTVLLQHRTYDSFGNIIDEANRGDFNGDGDFTAEDVDILLAAIGTVPDPDEMAWLDLDDDGDIDVQDVQILIREIYGTEMGDANLDGQVGGADFTALALHFGDPGTWGWAEGDFDGTTGGQNEVGGSDYTTLVFNFGFDNGQNGINSIVEYIFGFTGRLLDNETGLQNNLNRWYDPKVGRWISEDPIGFSAGDANLSRYVGNGPTNWVDPNGLQQIGLDHRSVFSPKPKNPNPNPKKDDERDPFDDYNDEEDCKVDLDGDGIIGDPFEGERDGEETDYWHQTGDDFEWPVRIHVESDDSDDGEKKNITVEVTFLGINSRSEEENDKEIDTNYNLGLNYLSIHETDDEGKKKGSGHKGIGDVDPNGRKTLIWSIEVDNKPNGTVVIRTRNDGMHFTWEDDPNSRTTTITMGIDGAYDQDHGLMSEK